MKQSNFSTGVDSTNSSLEEAAEEIFGSGESPAFRRWVDYWRETAARNRRLLSDFEGLALIDFQGRRILDIGCGTGGLCEPVSSSGGIYIGGDYHRHVLKFAQRMPSGRFTQCNALDLPFPSESFDMVFAFDIIEHLVGGKSWQLEFLSELKRVLSPSGVIFLTTPNFWYPYDAHTDLCCPQFMPGFIRDHYIRWKRPGFIQEHETFKNIRLMTPRFLRSCLRKVELDSLHELPCGLDRSDYIRLNPLRGSLAYLGLGWYFHAEFWMILTHRESSRRLRLKLRKNWFYEHAQPSTQPVSQFGSRIDFETGLWGHQLGPGWHWHESQEHSFRWIEGRAVCYLESRSPIRFLRLKGFSPIRNKVTLFCDGTWIGEHRCKEGERMDLEYLLPFRHTYQRIFEVEIRSAQMVRPGSSKDRRELAVMIFSVEIGP